MFVIFSCFLLAHICYHESFEIFFKVSVRVNVVGVELTQWASNSNFGYLNPSEAAYCNSSRNKINQKNFYK